MLQQSDLYHVTKLKRRYRPDLMTAEERQSSYRRPWFLRLHRIVGAPLRDLGASSWSGSAPGKARSNDQVPMTNQTTNGNTQCRLPPEGPGH